MQAAAKPPKPPEAGGLNLPRHLSHSARESLERCAKAWFLTRVAKAPKRPALWLAGGSAVHEVTEAWDRLAIHDDLRAFDLGVMWSHAFEQQLDKAAEKEPNLNVWRRSANEPIAAWNVLGPQFVQSYIQWRERSPWEIWTTPDGQPAIELDVSGMLPGCPVEIKAYLDRVFWDPVFKKHHILDLKSGKRAPKNADQFGTYAALLKVMYGIDVDSGVPFMNRKGGLGKPFDLTSYTPEYVGLVFGEAWEQVESGEFPANGFDSACFVCDVEAACYVRGGPLSAQYDPADPAYTPPY
jgi:putative RecB family exonuclease